MEYFATYWLMMMKLSLLAAEYKNLPMPGKIDSADAALLY